jgi:competence protein ComEC
LIAGVAAGTAFPWPWWVWGWLAVLPTVATLVFLYRSRRIRGPEPPSGHLLLVATIGVGCLLGSGLERHDRRASADLPDWAESDPLRAEGTLAEEPRLLNNGVELVLRDVRLLSMRVGGPAAPLPGRLAIFAREEAGQALLAEPVAGLPLPGQPVRVWGRLLRTDAGPTTPNPFNARRYWLSRGIFGRISATELSDLEIGPRPSGVWPAMLTALRGARAGMADNLAARLEGDRLALARALLLGDAGLISFESREAFARVGLAHLLAVSGLHTGFILLLLIGLARLCWLSPRATAWVGIVGLVCYAALTGFRPPVVRASTMGVFVLFGFAIGRWTTALSSIAAASWITLLLDPRNLLRLDWQLSYACALSITLLAPAIYDWMIPARFTPPGPAQRTPLWRRRVNQWFLLPVAVIVAVQIGMIPIQLAYFHRFNPLMIVTNLLSTPLTFLSVVGAVFTALLGWTPYLGSMAGELTRLSLGGLSWLIDLAGGMPLAIVNQRPMPPWLAGAYYLMLLGGVWLLTGRGSDRVLDPRQRISLLIHSMGALAIFAAAPLIGGFDTPGRLDLYMVDVGQGDCLVARFPNGRVMVVDAGAGTPFDQGRNTVAPFLRVLGVDRIDCLVATHADADHIGGLPHLLDSFEVGVFVAGPDTSESEIHATLERTLQRHGTPVIEARAGRRLEGFGDVTVTMLAPVAGLRDNDASIVLLIDHGDVELLATGDLEAGGERRLLADGSLPDIEVLKVGHHGSRTSTIDALLETARPEVALVSAGRRNRFGHPAPDVIARLERHGALVCRTDLRGTHWLRTNGKSLEVLEFAGSN